MGAHSEEPRQPTAVSAGKALTDVLPLLPGVRSAADALIAPGATAAKAAVFSPQPQSAPRRTARLPRRRQRKRPVGKQQRLTRDPLMEPRRQAVGHDLVVQDPCQCRGRRPRGQRGACPAAPHHAAEKQLHGGCPEHARSEVDEDPWSGHPRPETRVLQGCLPTHDVGRRAIIPRGGIRPCPIDRPCNIEEHVKGTELITPSGTISGATALPRSTRPRAARIAERAAPANVEPQFQTPSQRRSATGAELHFARGPRTASAPGPVRSAR
jgi:hypothetical protein